ncbi:histone deacetylase 11-like isoform X2 [Tubulanus polymorphus]|uniref:histone deacetylase 11-like isoform X2 n=1 Tax=Tubulanus polymorphus TaxID=672921 RepID=UPI003DA3424E
MAGSNKRMVEDEQIQNQRSNSSSLGTQLWNNVESWKWPIIYCMEYNIGFLGLEKLHPFDAGKWGKVHAFLKEVSMLRDDTTTTPIEATVNDLLVVHTKRYINSLKWSVNVAGITEVPPVALVPNFIVQRKVLRPFRFQTGGTIMGAKLAMERGWAINIGGGFHHCSANRGGGFCAYADITLAIKFLLERDKNVKNIMIIDLDAHQGNGHERDFMGDQNVYILDIYNRGIYPHDGFAKRAIKRKVELGLFTEDEEYLRLVKTHVDGALNEFTPDIVIYNAGTDILDGDPLGCLSISPEGIIERDQIVFQRVRTRGIPLLMVTSGGYQRATARIIADSILNLKTLGLIYCEEAENRPPPPPPELEPPKVTENEGFWARFRRSTNCAMFTRSATSSNVSELGKFSEQDNSHGIVRAKSTNAIDIDGSETNDIRVSAEIVQNCPQQTGNADAHLNCRIGTVKTLPANSENSENAQNSSSVLSAQIDTSQSKCDVDEFVAATRKETVSDYASTGAADAPGDTPHNLTEDDQPMNLKEMLKTNT